ncbi:hypothetical protein LAZ67_21002540 [Cordylochernes scorpioides]|uniref:Mos1 transposase HTH domain-containing protein n=1 Tax=Cordylochernes scorpioides TaxID=51811 RepID=A0ABY6LRP4_9ARAC|nr:hypothetical protein LAZ67_21002540 [Cordylochernes scorpioides]
MVAWHLLLQITFCLALDALNRTFGRGPLLIIKQLEEHELMEFVNGTLEFAHNLLREFKLGRSAAQETINIIEAWGEASSSERTTRRWFQKFKVGDFGLEDQDSRGRRSIFTNKDLKSHIESNNTQTVCEIQCKFFANICDEVSCRFYLWCEILSTLSVMRYPVDFCRILSLWNPVDLNYGFHRRVKAKTSLQDDDVPIDDTTTKPLFTPQEKGRKGTKDKVLALRWNPWQKHVRSMSETKLRFTILIQKQNGNLIFGALQNHLLLRKFAELEIERQLIVTGIQCLSVVFEKIKQSRSRAQLRGVLLHHDNARPHILAQTLDFLANSGVKLVTNPPYSPDLAHCEFLSPKVKLLLNGIKFDIGDEALQAFINTVNSIPEDDYCKCYDNWFSRIKYCIGAKEGPEGRMACWRGDVFFHSFEGLKASNVGLKLLAQKGQPFAARPYLSSSAQSRSSRQDHVFWQYNTLSHLSISIDIVRKVGEVQTKRILDIFPIRPVKIRIYMEALVFKVYLNIVEDHTDVRRVHVHPNNQE